MEEIMISALQHYAYCPRQCALIHLEQVFEENEFTMKGHISHKHVHNEIEGTESSTSLTLWSDKYGLIGKSDKVEWIGKIPKPVEYKYGRKNKSVKLPDEVQLCAQVICLEEMFDVPIDEGEIFYVSSNRRETIVITDNLRRKTIETINLTRQMIDAKQLPKPVNDERCTNCSLIDICMPDISFKSDWKVEWGKAFKDGTIT